MRILPSFQGEIAPAVYAIAAPALLLSQHLAVILAFTMRGASLGYDAAFFLLPLRRLAELPGLTSWAAALAFAFSLVVAWGLALLSFRRASHSGRGFALAAFAVVPAIQIVVVAILAAMPVRRADPEYEPGPERHGGTAHVVQGVLAGVGLIVGAVLVSAVTFGAYGWGLFVMTPFLVGVTTAYIANRRIALEPGHTTTLVLAAGALGTLALVMLALEGLVCILLASPLAAGAAIIGGLIGRAVALAGQRRGKPLLSVALLPALFALEAAMPPDVSIRAEETIDIAASPALVWQELTSGDPIATPPGLVALAGLAYPLRGRLNGEGVGAERIGDFSTGSARERITAWVPGRTLAFTVLTQPPAMEEMSPYRRVHAPHVEGYFETTETRFDLMALPGGGTRLVVRGAHRLRMDPVLYWEPIARWAIHENLARVLSDISNKAEARAARAPRRAAA